MSTPRTKRMKQFQRLNSALHWTKTYDGKSLVRGYSKRYGVDKLCAIRELRMLGVEISEEFENNLRSSLRQLWDQRRLRKQKRKQQNHVQPLKSDWYHAIIIGYTDGGASYGITWEEMEEINRAENRFVHPIHAPLPCSDDEPPKIDDIDLLDEASSKAGFLKKTPNRLSRACAETKGECNEHLL